MKYVCETVIDLPREAVIGLFMDPEALPKWQKGLAEMTPLTGEPGAEGATTRLRYDMGKREIVMIETIVVNDLPDRFVTTYEAKGMWNQNENLFTGVDDKTLWEMKCEFRGQGMLRLMTWLMPGMFQKQTERSMKDFKQFAENR